MYQQLVFEKEDEEAVNKFSKFVEDYCMLCVDCHECIFNNCLKEEVNNLKLVLKGER